MKKLLFTLFFAAAAQSGWAIETDGNGVYQIGTAQDLVDFASLVNSGTGAANAVLTADIDMSGKGWTPIGQDQKDYKGHFNGQGHRILHLTTSAGYNNQGLFGQAVGGAIIENIIIDRTCTIQGKDYTAGILGHVWGDGVIVRNCGNEADIKGSGINSAGIIGCSQRIVYISNCYNTGKIEGSTECAGICAWMGNASSTISNCYSTATSIPGNALWRYDQDLSAINNYSIQSGQGTSISEEDVTSGRLCYKLNGETQGGTTWYQNLPNSSGDAHPYPFSTASSPHKLVYKFGTADTYVNDGNNVSIGSAADLDNFSSVVNSDGLTSLNATLSANITANNTFIPIGTETNMYHGTFDGGEHSIALNISSGSTLGLFGYATGGTEIKDLVLIGSVSGSGNCAALIGQAGKENESGTITIKRVGCEVSVTSSGADSRNGAFVGNDYGKTIVLNIEDSYNTGTINCTSSFTSVVGNHVPTSSVFKNVYNKGSISSDKFVNYFDGSFTNCYTTTSGNSGVTGTLTQGIAITKITSGELCYKLNSGTSVWKQTIGTDDYPKLYGATGVVNQVVADESYSNLTVSTNKVRIGSLANLKQFSAEVNAGNNSMNAILTENITDDGTFTPIGTDTYRYKGTFDGNEKSIELDIDTSVDYQALIGHATGGITIKNLVLKGQVKSTGGRTGGFIAEAKGGGDITIQKCGNEAAIEGGGNETAAIVANNYDYNCKLIIENVYNTGNVKGSGDVSTICACQGNSASVFTNVYNTGTQTDTNGTTAAKFVRTPKSATYTNCYSTIKSNTDDPASLNEINTTNVTSGELCFKLNNETSVWKQKIGGTKGYPNFDDTEVVNEVVADESYSNLTVSDSKVQIGTPANLTQFSKEVKAGNTSMDAELTASISAESGFEPIGNADHKYAGEFDGKEKTITLSINNISTDNQGLFGVATGGANIHDLIVAGSVKGKQYVAGVLGKAITGQIRLTNVINTAAISAATGDNISPDAAGLVGSVASSTYITVTNCGNTGAVSGKTNYCAALCGWSQTGSTYTNCWNIGNISNVSGSNQLYRNEGTLNNCFDASASASRGQGTLLNSGAAASGELGFMLNAAKTSGEDWYQTIGTHVHPFPFSSYGELPSLTATDGWYEISEPWQLCWMAVNVNEKNATYKNANIKLTADIDYSAYTDQAAMFGKPNNTYKGIFDGQCHTVTVAFNNTIAEETGLIRQLKGGIIRNLEVGGTINTTQKLAGGICASIYGSGTIINCVSGVTITSTKVLPQTPSDSDKDATFGGILARVYQYDIVGDIVVSNCLFSGSISAANRNCCGGVAGWTATSNKVKVENCLVTGTFTFENSAKNYVIARVNTDADPTKNAVLNNNYYTSDVSGSSYSNVTKNGTQKAEGLLSTGELCFLLNGEEPGGEDWYQNLTGTVDSNPLPFSTHKKVYKYSDALYTNFEVSDGKVQINNATDLTNFSALVNEGNYNLNAELTNDIDMTDKSWTPIGKFEKSANNDNDDKNDGSKAYHGTFDGNGFTIDNLVQDVTLNNNQGLFGVVTGGCTIQNLILGSGCQFYGGKFVGAFVGSSRGSSSGVVTIENCGNEANVGSDTNKPTMHAAAFIGVVVNGGPQTHITNCYNKGSIKGGSGSESAILTGWFGGHSNVEVNNFYNIGVIENAATNCPLYRNGNSLNTFSNVYHTSEEQSATQIEDGWLTSGELCYRLGSAFTQDLSEEGYPTFGSKAVTAGQWFSNSNDVYYNLEDGNYTVYQLNMSDTQTKYAVPASVTAKNVSISRTIPAKKWIGLCLPFDYDIPSGWDVRELDHVNGTGDEACMVFTAASSIEAGKPYIVKPTDEVTSITATNKSIATAASTVEEGDVNMIGNFAQTSIPVGSFYINNNSELKKLTGSSVNMKGFRAYFTVANEVKALNFAFDDDADGISPLLTSPEEEGQIYNLAGQRINKVQKGINIVNGRKVLF